MTRRTLIIATLSLAFVAAPSAAQEVFVGAYVHGVDTPLTLPTGEGGADLELGYRFARQPALSLIGNPAPYVIGSVNSRGGTVFAGGGLSWKLGKGPIYLRPAVGLIVNDAPRRRVGAKGLRTDLGSPVLFEPEIALGARLSPEVAIEASWVHISGARLFNSRQNPGIDMMGVRLVFALE
jgi:lipid A 3-O-deacylase